jgi:hypothetical protein
MHFFENCQEMGSFISIFLQTAYEKEMYYIEIKWSNMKTYFFYQPIYCKFCLTVLK